MKQRHRIFIAINLPADVKKSLSRYQATFAQLPATWVPKENLHITLEFLGGLYDHQLPQAVGRAKEIAANFKGPFEIALDRIAYGPTDKLPPRMLWATGGNYHVTLAKISAMEWRQIELEERPEVREQIDLLFSVESIEVMESVMKKAGPSPRQSGLWPREGGPVYTVIESIPLQ